jgi:hypothetical protein
LVETTRMGDILTRRIVAFRKLRAAFRRSEEVHRLQLYDPGEVLADLAANGFHARTIPRWGQFALPRGLHAYIAIRT